MTLTAAAIVTPVLAAEEVANELPAEPWVFGLVALSVFLGLLFITLSFNKR